MGRCLGCGAQMFGDGTEEMDWALYCDDCDDEMSQYDYCDIEDEI